jgi:hypothetical protein
LTSAMFACEVREGSVTRQVKTLDNVGQFIMKKPRPALGADRGFSVQPLDGWPCGYHPGSILADAGGYKKPRHIVANADRGLL